MLDIPNNSPKPLQDKVLDPRINKAYKKLESEKGRTDSYYIILLAVARSPFRDFESYFIIVVRLEEDDVQLVSKQYVSNFVTFETSSGIHSIKDNSEVVFTICDHATILKTKYNYLSMKTKLLLSCLGGIFGMLRFDKKKIFNTNLGFIPYWDYKPTNAIHVDSSCVCTNEQFINLSTKVENLLNFLKCAVFDGSVLNGVRQPILFSFVLNKPL